MLLFLTPLFTLEVTVHKLDLIVLSGVGLGDFEILHSLREGSDCFGKLLILLIFLSELTFDFLKFPDLRFKFNLPSFLLKLVAEVVHAIMKFLVS